MAFYQVTYRVTTAALGTMITFLSALGAIESFKESIQEYIYVVIVAIVFAGISYSCAIVFLHFAERRARNEYFMNNKKTFLIITAGQVSAIFFLYCLALWVMIKISS